MGDVFVLGGGESVQITAIHGGDWTVTRSHDYYPAAAHNSGDNVTAACNAQNNNSGWSSTYWKFLDDPLGTDVTNKKVIVDDYWPTGGHDDWGPSVRLTEGYEAVVGSPIADGLNTPINFFLDSSPLFAGKLGKAYGTSYASHPSYHQVPPANMDWFLDMLPFDGGNQFSPNPGVTQVSGQLYKLLFNDYVPPFSHRKALATFAMSKDSQLTDISGPNSVLSDTAADAFKYCVALVDGECRPDSKSNDVYANVPGLTHNYCTEIWNAQDVCIAPMATYGNSVAQLGLLPNSVGEPGGPNRPSGAGYSRVLTHALAPFRSMGAYPASKSLADASWALFGVDGAEPTVWMVKLPPFISDNIDRSTFMPLRLNLNAPLGTVTAAVEFGYREQGGFCTSRREKCFAVSDQINEANPFIFESEPHAGVPCLISCTVVVPVLPMHVVYYQAKYFDALGNVMGLGDAGVGAETASAGAPLPQGAGYSVRVASQTAAAASNITITWTAPAGITPVDWIGIFPVGAPNSARVNDWFVFTSGAITGSVNAIAPYLPGQYEVRYFINNSQTEVARSAPFTVTAAGAYTLIASPQSVVQAGNLTVTWNAPAGRSAKDWIGLFQVGAGSGAPLWQQYTSGAALGTATISAPNSTNNYEFRYFLNDSLTQVAVSNGVTVVAPAAPVISSVFASGITASAATISWKTDSLADSQLEYGTTANYGWTTLNGGGVTTHSFSLSGLSAGTLYHYRVKSANQAGVRAVSGDFVFTTSAPAAANATATFVNSDTTTRGNWRTSYGAEGYNLAADGLSNPTFAAPVVSGSRLYAWFDSTFDGRALQKVAKPGDRIEASWYSQNQFTIDLNITDRAQHQVALYCVDYDTTGRRQTIDALDENGNVLNTQQLTTSFNNGIYLVWNVSGRITFRITSTAGLNGVVAGVFFGGPVAPPAATAVFFKADRTTQGNWRSVYGADGYNVIGDAVTNPAYVAPVGSGQSSYTWTASTSDSRGLLKSSSTTDHIEAAWYSPTSFTVDMNITDQAQHQLAVYCVDYDSSGRRQVIDVLDPHGNVLNSQPMGGSFNRGVYLVWKVTGHIKLRFTWTAGSNAVVSGLFFGGRP